MARAVPPSEPIWRLRLRGDPALLHGGRIHPLERRAAALLALVALEPGFGRARAASWLWPDSANPRATLRQQLLRFRRFAGFGLVEGDEALRLAADVAFDVDAEDPAQPLLGAHAFDDLEPFSAWLALQQRRLVEDGIARAQAALTGAQACDDTAGAVAAARRLVAVDPDTEAHHRTLMRALYLAADTAGAQAAYEHLERWLAARYGALPSAQTQELARALRQVDRAAAHRVAVELPPTLLRPPRRIGRAGVWQRLRDAWQSRGVLLVEAQAGLGKTRLLADFAGGLGQVARVGGRPGDAQVPYAVLSRLLRPLAQGAGAGLPPAMRRELARLLPELGEPAPAGRADALLVAQAVEALIAAAARAGLAGVIVDDLHFCDTASGEALLALAAAPLGLAWLMAARGDELPAPLRARIDTMAAARTLQLERLAPLNVGEVAEFLDSLGAAVAPYAGPAPDWLRRTGGSPLFLLEALKSRWGGDDTGDDVRVPATVAAVIGARFARLSPPATRLLHCAAVAGPELSVGLAAQVLGSPAVDLVGAWAELERADMLRGSAFAHDLVQDAARAAVPAAIARHLHGLVATALATATAPGAAADAVIARHWLASDRPQQALAPLRRAAAQASRAGRTLEAAAFLDAAVALALEAGDSDAAFDDAHAAAECLHASPSLPAFEAAVQRLQPLAVTGAQQARAALAEADLVNQGADPAAYRSAIERAQALARACGELRVHTRCELALGVDAYRDAQLRTCLGHLDAAVALAQRCAQPQLLGEALSMQGIALDTIGRLDDAQATLERAATQLEAAGRSDFRILNQGYFGYLALDRGRLGDAEAAVEAIRALRGPHGGNPMYGAFAAAFETEVHRRAGRYAEALRVAEAVPDAGRSNAGTFVLELERTRVLLALGRADLAQAALERLAGAFQPRRRQWLLLLLCRAEVAVERGRALPAELDLALLQTLEEPVLEAAALHLLAPTLPAPAAQPLLARAEQRFVQMGLGGVLPGLAALQSRCAAALGDTDVAAAHARRALGWLDTLAPTQSRGDVLAEVGSAASASPAVAAQAHERRQAWLQRVAERDVPGAFRASFLSRARALASRGRRWPVAADPG